MNRSSGIFSDLHLASNDVSSFLIAVADVDHLCLGAAALPLVELPHVDVVRGQGAHHALGHVVVVRGGTHLHNVGSE